LRKLNIESRIKILNAYLFFKEKRSKNGSMSIVYLSCILVRNKKQAKDERKKA